MGFRLELFPEDIEVNLERKGKNEGMLACRAEDIFCSNIGYEYLNNGLDNMGEIIACFILERKGEMDEYTLTLETSGKVFANYDILVGKKDWSDRYSSDFKVRERKIIKVGKVSLIKLEKENGENGYS